MVRLEAGVSRLVNIAERTLVERLQNLFRR
jgi:hypothetical protein